MNPLLTADPKLRVVDQLFDLPDRQPHVRTEAARLARISSVKQSLTRLHVAHARATPQNGRACLFSNNAISRSSCFG